jgi:toxin ParE1/3/4
MKMKVSLTPKARADLKDISRYTNQTWGRQQRLTYLKQLNNAFSFLAENPQRGKKRNEIIGSPYSYHVGRHVIFYRPIAEGIQILRILHDSMDFPQHFKPMN